MKVSPLILTAKGIGGAGEQGEQGEAGGAGEQGEWGEWGGKLFLNPLPHYPLPITQICYPRL
jgi:hypothetical protein